MKALNNSLRENISALVDAVIMREQFIHVTVSEC